LIEQRLSIQPTDIRDTARALSREFAAQVEELKNSKPNDPGKLADYDRLVAFFEKMAAGLAALADTLDQAIAHSTNGQLEPVFLGAAGKIVGELHGAMVEWLAEHRTMVIDVPIRLALFGLGVTFLHGIGADGVAAIGALTALVLRRAPKRAPKAGAEKKAGKRPRKQ
jgi:hypothetical protein